jgi:hypothetical protein
MSGRTITEAMRYGADARDYEEGDLGKFGLGLKTASMSQCRRLTVASRIDPHTKRGEARQFDLDHIEATNRWEVFVLGSAERSDILVSPLLQHTGTVVLWEKLDRVLDYRDPWGERARKGLLALTERLEEHLSMVFHRFISAEARKVGSRSRKIIMTVNGAPLDAWDPFARSEPATQTLEAQNFPVQVGGHAGTVRYQPYILPPEKRFSSKAAHERASGPSKWNSQQGFYIYRADRMIQSGGWCRMRTADEHTKLARVALDFDPDLDEAFEISVNKTRVKLSADLREVLKDHVTRVTALAKGVYGRKEGATTPSPAASTSAGPRPDSTANGPSAASSTPLVSVTPPPTGKNTPEKARTPSRLRKALEAAAAQAGAEESLQQIVSIIQRIQPDIARELGW